MRAPDGVDEDNPGNSGETKDKGKLLNEMRAKKGLKPVQVIAVELVKAEDGSPISSSRIRAGEIDSYGRLIHKD